HISAFISLHDEDSPGLHRAAADAVEALATSEAMISKVIKTEDLQTDGAKVANALLVRARQLREEADREEAKDDQSAFDIVDFTPLPRIFWRRSSCAEPATVPGQALAYPSPARGRGVGVG